VSGAWPHAIYRASSTPVHLTTAAGVRRGENTGGPRVDFRPDAEPWFDVEIGYEARAEILRVIHSGFQALGRQVEQGGLLLSMYPPRDGSVVISHATGPAPGSRHSSHEVQIGRAGDIFRALPDTMQRANMTWAGIWHTHPGRTSRTPSDHDLQNWARTCGGEVDSYVGLIVTSDPAGDHGWDTPVVTPYVTYRADQGFVCERARITNLMRY
jgi:hypothetical protein